MSNQQTFHKPGKTFKQVKAVSLNIAGRDGSDIKHSVMVYMSTAGDVGFSIGLPDDYKNAWLHHRQKDHHHILDEKVRVIDGVVHAASFNQVVEDLVRIAKNFQKHIRSVTVEKVIRIHVELKSKAGVKNEPSFSKAKVLVGLSFSQRWAVNGTLYQSERNRHNRYDTADVEFSEMSPTGEYAGVVIPYTDEAWTALVRVEHALESAAEMLLSLNSVESAVAALASGRFGLLADATSSAPAALEEA